MFAIMSSTSNPWQTKSKNILFENPWIVLEDHEVINPSGNPGKYSKVHFKNRAVAILPVSEGLETWLVGQYRYTLDQYSWELPMGGVPYDEDLLLGAQRELIEETGLTAAKWEQVMVLHTSNCVTDEVGYVYLATDLQQGLAQPDETEALVVKKLPLKAAYKMAMNGTITDAISVAALLRLAPSLL